MMRYKWVVGELSLVDIGFVCAGMGIIWLFVSMILGATTAALGFAIAEMVCVGLLVLSAFITLLGFTFVIVGLFLEMH